MPDSTDRSVAYDLSPTEIVYRRIAESNAKYWIKNGKVSANAFLPNKGDTTGLSLARVQTAQAAAETGKVGKRFYAVPLAIAKISARKEIQLIADSATHALILGWTFDTRDHNDVREGADFLAAICGVPEGPFDGKFEGFD